MNQISSALAQAGIKLPPLTRRIWQLLHDSKLPRSAACLASMLHVPRGNVSSAINSMYSRGMIALARHEPTRIKGPRGTSINRSIAQWAAVGQDYELLQVLPTTKAKPPASVEVEQQPQRAVEQFELDIEKMPLSKAFDLYKRLQEFFGANND